MMSWMEAEDPAKARTADGHRSPAGPDQAAESITAAWGEPNHQGAEQPPRIEIFVTKDGERGIRLDHPDPDVGRALLMRSIGTSNRDFWRGLLRQLYEVASESGEISESQLNFLLSIIQGIQPRDQVEAMLAAQMAAVHMATMRFAGGISVGDNRIQQDNAERSFNRLTRAFIAQLEALKRYRTGGEQKVTVQHVTVSEGGQAIVGNVTQRAPRAAKNQTAASPTGQTDASAAFTASVDLPHDNKSSATLTNDPMSRRAKPTRAAVARKPKPTT